MRELEILDAETTRRGGRRGAHKPKRTWVLLFGFSASSSASRVSASDLVWSLPKWPHFLFAPYASDGKVPPGSLSGEDEKDHRARPFGKQGLTPIYSEWPPSRGLRDSKLPVFRKDAARRSSSSPRNSRRCSTPASARPRPLHHRELNREHVAFRLSSCLDVLRVLQERRRSPTQPGTHPRVFSDLYINMVRAGEASGRCGIVEALSEF